jgi:signal transduction histidine kinase
LTVILANVGILLRHKDETVGQQQKWVEYTKEEAERMKKLVDEMLFLAKSDAARTSIPFLPQNFSDIVWNNVLPFESVAFELHVTLENHIVPEVFLQGDEGQLKQLVAILLDNACKYAGEGGKVTVSLEKGQDKARLAVHNTGTPIPPDQLPRIFDRFIRADSSRARSQGGYGLGLAIAKTIVEGHKGKITVESSAADGTIFIVTLPLKMKQ